MTSIEAAATRLIALAFAAAGLCASAVGAPTECRPTEQTLFSCSLGQKKIAVCASQGWSAQAGTLQYRFGLSKGAELVLPRGPHTAPAASARAGSMMFSGGGGATLRFSSGKVDYIVYTATSSSWGDSAGVVVEREGKTLRALKCRGQATSMLGEALFRKGGFRRDELPFEMPE